MCVCVFVCVRAIPNKKERTQPNQHFINNIFFIIIFQPFNSSTILIERLYVAVLCKHKYSFCSRSLALNLQNDALSITRSTTV